jgi:hypothetical protein
MVMVGIKHPGGHILPVDGFLFERGWIEEVESRQRHLVQRIAGLVPLARGFQLKIGLRLGCLCGTAAKYA